jgi:hypothetical protein
MQAQNCIASDKILPTTSPRDLPFLLTPSKKLNIY